MANPFQTLQQVQYTDSGSNLEWCLTPTVTIGRNNKFSVETPQKSSHYLPKSWSSPSEKAFKPDPNIWEFSQEQFSIGACWALANPLF